MYYVYTPSPSISASHLVTSHFISGNGKGSSTRPRAGDAADGQEAAGEIMGTSIEIP